MTDQKEKANSEKKKNDKFAEAVLALEEAIFELEDLLQNHEFLPGDREDLKSAMELAISSRDLTTHVIASTSGKIRKKKISK